MKKRDFRILVADDDEIVRDVIRSLLVREGYTVLSAHDGLEAIRILRIEDIHLVITDLRMPRADGIEVLRSAVKINPDTAVVIMTAYGTLDTTLDAIREGAYNYLTKPFKGLEITLVADRTYQMATLIHEKRELIKQLREMHRDSELLKTVVTRGDPDVTIRWIERVENLRSMGVLSPSEAEILKERLIKGNAEG